MHVSVQNVNNGGYDVATLLLKGKVKESFMELDSSLSGMKKMKEKS